MENSKLYSHEPTSVSMCDESLTLEIYQAKKCVKDMKIMRPTNGISARPSIQVQLSTVEPNAKYESNADAPDIKVRPSSLPISKLSRMFDAQITDVAISELLLWYLYFDLVDQSSSVDEKMWDIIDSDTISNWIRLGKELQSTQSLGFPGLQKACDELLIPMPAASRRLIRLSDRTTMLRTEIGERGVADSDARIQGILATKLWHDRTLALKLRPSQDSHWAAKQAAIIASIDSYLAIVFRLAVRDSHFPEITDKIDEVDFRQSIRQAWLVLAQTRSPAPGGAYDLAEYGACSQRTCWSYSTAFRSHATWPVRTSSLPSVGPWQDFPRIRFTYPGYDVEGNGGGSNGDKGLSLYPANAIFRPGADNRDPDNENNEECANREEGIELATFRIIRGKTLRGSLVNI